MGIAPDNTCVSALVTRADRARIQRFAQESGQSVNTFLRGAMSDALEDAGEAPLAPMATGMVRVGEERAAHIAYMRQYRDRHARGAFQDRRVK